MAEQPLVDFGLAFVGLFVFVVQAGFFFGGGGFVVDHVDLLFGVDPDVIHGSGNEQVGGFVVRLDSLKVGAPGFQIFVLKGDRVDLVFGHEWVRLLLVSVLIELVFQQLVHGRIEREGRHAGQTDATAAIQIEEMRRLEEELNLRPAELVWMVRVGVEGGVVDVAGSGHGGYLIVPSFFAFDISLLRSFAGIIGQNCPQTHFPFLFPFFPIMKYPILYTIFPVLLPS